jgi:hypothetical protein
LAAGLINTFIRKFNQPEGQIDLRSWKLTTLRGFGTQKSGHDTCMLAPLWGDHSSNSLKRLGDWQSRVVFSSPLRQTARSSHGSCSKVQQQTVQQFETMP